MTLMYFCLEMLNNTILLILFRPAQCCRGSWLWLLCLCCCRHKNDLVLNLDVEPNSKNDLHSPITLFKSVLNFDSSLDPNENSNDEGEERTHSPADDEEEEGKAVLKRQSSYLRIDQVPESFYYQNNEKI